MDARIELSAAAASITMDHRESAIMEELAREEAQQRQKRPRACGLPRPRVLLAYAACLVLGAVIGAGLTVLIDKFSRSEPGVRDVVHDWKYDILTEEELRVYSRLLVTIRNEFRENGVGWWLTDGTLLGATRNYPPGQVRWDDDMDIGFMREDEGKVKDVLRKLSKEGKIEWGMYGEWFYQVKLAGEHMRKNFYLDIFPFEWRENGQHGRGYYYAGTGYNKWPEIAYLEEEVGSGNVVDCPFNGEVMSCPKNKEAIMHRQYGPNALTTAVVYGHEDMNGKQKFTFSLSEDVNRHMAILPALNRDLLPRLAFKDKGEA